MEKVNQKSQATYLLKILIISYHFCWQLPAEVRDDGLKEVFQAEDEILATFSPASNPTDSLQSNRDLMELHLRKVLSLPRNAKIFEDNRLKVGGFIFKALAKSGLLVGSYKFHFQRVSVNDQEVKKIFFFFWVSEFLEREKHFSFTGF